MRFKKLLPAPLLPLALLLAPSIEAKGEERGPGCEGDDGKGTDDVCREDPEPRPSPSRGPSCTGPPSSRQECKPSERPYPMIGRFSREGPSTARGSFVEFRYTREALLNVSLFGVPLLQSIVFPSPSEKWEVHDHGSLFRVEGEDWEVRIHDTPTGAVVGKKEGVFEIHVAQGVQPSKVPRGIALRSPTLEAYLVSSPRTSLEDGRIVVEAPFTLVVRPPEGVRSIVDPEALRTLLERRELGAEVTVVKNSTGFLHDAIEYANVTIQTAVGHRNVTFTIFGEGREGRVLLFHLDPSLFGNVSLGEIRATFDGRILPPASSLADVLNPDDDGLDPEGWMVEDALGYELLVSVPHYSVHVLSVGAPLPLTPPTVVGGVIVGIVVLLGAGSYLFRRGSD